MRNEVRSVVNLPISNEESITISNPNGDLIIDASITATNGSITLEAQNIYLTSKATLFALKGNTNIKATENVNYTGGEIRTDKLNIKVVKSPTMGKCDQKAKTNDEIRLFNHSKLRVVSEEQKNLYTKSLS